MLSIVPDQVGNDEEQKTFFDTIPAKAGIQLVQAIESL